jgi:hypothetical protein
MTQHCELDTAGGQKGTRKSTRKKLQEYHEISFIFGGFFFIKQLPLV